MSQDDYHFESEPVLSWRERLRPFVLPVDAKPANPVLFGGRVLVLIMIALWTPSLVQTDLASPDALAGFLHGPYLVFHEAGHVLFSAFGSEFLTIAGGTLMQLIIPALAFGAFMMSRNIFGAAVGLWWFAGSLMDCAPYIFDARRGVLPLLGGTTGSEHPDYHDWSNMLRRLGWMRHDQSIGRAVMFIGSALAILAVVWGAVLLWRQFRGLKLDAAPHEWGD